MENTDIITWQTNTDEKFLMGCDMGFDADYSCIMVLREKDGVITVINSKTMDLSHLDRVTKEKEFNDAVQELLKYYNVKLEKYPILKKTKEGMDIDLMKNLLHEGAIKLTDK